MKVNLDQIEFYHGPGLQQPSTSAKNVPPDHATAHAPQNFPHSFPTELGFCPRPCEVSIGKAPPLTGTTHEWNIFDIEINNLYDSTQPQTTKDTGSTVTTNMQTARDSPLDSGSSALAFSEPVPSRDSATPVPCPAETYRLDRLPDNMGESDLPYAAPDTKEMEASRLPCMPGVTAPPPAPEQASSAFSDLSGVGNPQQGSAERKLSITGPSDSMHPGSYEKDTEASQTSDLGGNPCSRANNAPEQAKDSGTAKDKLAPSGLSSAPPTVRSTSECSRARTSLSSDIPARYPSIAVVVPPPSQKQGATRTSTRAAAAVCKKRLRSGRGTGIHQDGNAPYDTNQPCQKRKKRRSSIRPFSDLSNPSIPVLSHCSGAIQGVHGSALLTVESNSGLKPAYFFTFVPDPSPMPSRPHTAVVPEKPRPYSSDENALLVRLKEREVLSWSEIASYFPDRNTSSLQVHYSTKLRHKVSSRSGKPRRYQ